MGILAMAGAAGGLGQGAVEVGQQGQKMDLLKKQNDLATMRETALAQMRIEAEKGMQQAGFGEQEKMFGKEAELRSSIATNQIKAKREMFGASLEQQKALAGAHNTTITNIAKGHDIARETAAKYAHPPKPAASAWGKPLNVTNETPSDPKDPLSAMIKTQVPVMTHRDGSQWVSGGDGNIYPYKPGAPDGVAQRFDPANYNRQQLLDKQKATQTLLADPLAVTPSGMTARDSYVQRYQGLPSAYLAAEDNARTARGEGGYESGAPDMPEPPDASESGSGPEAAPVSVPED